MTIMITSVHGSGNIKNVYRCAIIQYQAWQIDMILGELTHVDKTKQLVALTCRTDRENKDRSIRIIKWDSRLNKWLIHKRFGHCTNSQFNTLLDQGVITLDTNERLCLQPRFP